MSEGAEKLEAMGLVCCGEWHLEATQPEYTLERHATAQNVVYAFIVSDEVAYVGKTTQQLQRRMYGYRWPGPIQSTDIKCNAYLREALQNGVSSTTKCNTFDVEPGNPVEQQRQGWQVILDNPPSTLMHANELVCEQGSRTIHPGGR